MNAVIYARVSTDEQAERQKSIPDQMDACRQYCRERGWEVLGEWSDPGVSGTVWPRRGLSGAMRAIGKKGVDRIVVWTFSRLARSTRLFHRIAWDLEEAGAQLVAVDQDKASELERDIHAAIDAEYVRRIQRDVKRAFARMHKRRQFTGGKQIMGYRWESKDRRVVVKSEARVVRHVFRMADPFGACEPIVAIAEATGIKRARVHRMLRDPTYAGAYVTGRMRYEGGKRISAPRSKWQIHWGAHEAIVDRDLWERVQERLDGNADRTMGNRGREQLALTGLLRCGKCGRPMSLNARRRSAGGGTFYYYVCKSQHYQRGDGECTGVGVVRVYRWAEELVAAILDQLTRPDLAKKLAEHARRTYRAGHAEGTLQSEVRRLEKAEATLLAVMTSGQVSDTDRIAGEYGKIERALGKARAALRRAGKNRPLMTAAGIQRRLRAAAAELRRPDLDGRDLDHAARPLLHRLVEAITIPENGGEAVVELRAERIAGSSSIARLPGRSGRELTPLGFEWTPPASDRQRRTHAGARRRPALAR